MSKTIKSQNWRPDTCGCVIAQIFDYATDPPALVKETLTTACDHHATPEDVRAENVSKNRAVVVIAETLEVPAESVAWDIDGNGDDRTITVDHPELKTADPADLKAIAEKLASIGDNVQIPGE